MKKIKFKTILPDLLIAKPTNSNRAIPQWFRNFPRVIEGVETVKACMPFLDALTTGYTLYLSADVYFENGQCSQISTVNFVEAHRDTQIDNVILSDVYSPTPYKWINHFITETPRGYSCMIVHPSNRLDLPFYTLSGVVDTDNFPAPINFPFLIQKDFTGIIKEGTPIAQIIPFKRIDWDSEVIDNKQAKIPVSFLNNIMSPPFGFYRKKYWKRKLYK